MAKIYLYLTLLLSINIINITSLRLEHTQTYANSIPTIPHVDGTNTAMPFTVNQIVSTNSTAQSSIVYSIPPIPHIENTNISANITS
jgi:hypothetical protein